MMTHEPECPVAWIRDCICTELRAAYQRGYSARAHLDRMNQDLYGGTFTQHGKGENP